MVFKGRERRDAPVIDAERELGGEHRSERLAVHAHRLGDGHPRAAFKCDASNQPPLLNGRQHQPPGDWPATGFFRSTSSLASTAAYPAASSGWNHQLRIASRTL